jgi:hypothetical protein
LERLKNLEEFTKLNELFNLNEQFLFNFLKTMDDIFDPTKTSFDHRKQAFEYLIQFYQKKRQQFETPILKNYLLRLLNTQQPQAELPFDNIINRTMNINIERSKPTTTQTKYDDIIYRFTLFCFLSNDGKCCKSFDPELTCNFNKIILFITSFFVEFLIFFCSKLHAFQVFF